MATRLSRLAPLSAASLCLLVHGPLARADEVAPPPAQAAAAPASGPDAAPTPAQPAPDAAPAPGEAPPEEPEPIEVSIAGTRVRDTSGSAHVVRPKQLEQFEYDDPHQILQSVPGVYVRGEDGFGLRPNIGMRGALSDRSKKLTLMEDGVLFGPAPYSAPAAYYFPVMTRMYTVRVVKGPSALVYGPHTVAGAIDLVTQPIPDGEHVYADLAAGMYLSRKAHVRASASGDHLGVLIEGVHLANDGFKSIDGLPDADTGFSRNELMLKARASFGGEATLRHELELKLGYANEFSNETYLGLTDEDFAADPLRRYAASQLDRMEWHRTQLALTHVARRGDELELTSTFYRNDLTRTWRKVNGFRGADLSDVLADPDTPAHRLFKGLLDGSVPATTREEAILIGPNDRTFVSQGFQTRLLYKPKTGPITHKIEIGARIHHDSVRRAHSQEGYLADGAALTPDGEGVEVTADNDASTFALALWGVESATWGPVTASAGARVESIQSRMQDALSARTEGITQQIVLPGGGVFVALPYALGVFAGVYQGFSPIPPGQSENVTPEKSVNLEWGARWSPERLVRVEAIGFFNKYSNLSNVCTFSTGCVEGAVDQQFDGGEATVMGLEVYADVEAKLAWATLPARLAYTFTRATFDSTFSSADPIFGEVEQGDDVPYVPAHQASASLGLETTYFGGSVAGTFVSAMREVAGSGAPAEGEATDPHFLLDASLKASPFSFLSIYVTGKNLLDMRYVASRRPFGARPGAPVNVQAGVKATY